MGKRLFKIVVTLLLLVIAFLILDWKKVINIIGQVHPIAGFMVVFLIFTHFLLTAWRWHILLDLPAIFFLKNLKVYLYGNFLNSFTPANLGGDVYRFAALKQYSSNRMYFIGRLIEERILGLFFFLVCYVLFYLISFFAWSGPNPRLFFISSVVSGICAMLMLIIPYSNSWINKIFGHYASPKIAQLFFESRFGMSLRPSLMLFRLTLLSVAAVFLWITSVYIVALDLNCLLPWSVVGIIAILVELLRFIPMTVQGIGLREGAYAYLFHLFGYSPESGFAVGVAVYLFLNIVLFLSGLVSMVIPINRTFPKGA